MGFQATTEWDLLKGTGSPWFNRDYIPSPASPQLPVLRSKLPNHLLLLPKGLDLAKQRSYKGVSQVRAQILTCVNGEFGTARLSEQLFWFPAAFFLGEGGGMDNQQVMKHPEEITASLLPMCTHRGRGCSAEQEQG